MKLKLLDGNWEVEVFLDRSEPGYTDNVFLRITEACPATQKLLKSGQVTLGMTAADAQALARQLMSVALADEAAAREESSRPASRFATEPARQLQRGQRVSFTAKQGQYLAFIHRYVVKFGRAPAESDIQRHLLVSAPTVNQMMQRLERLGLIARAPGQARSIRLLVPLESLPPSF